MQFTTNTLDRAARRIDPAYLESLGATIPTSVDESRYAVLWTLNRWRTGDPAIPEDHIRALFLCPTTTGTYEHVALVLPEIAFNAITWAPYISDAHMPTADLSPALLDDLTDHELEFADLAVYTVIALKVAAANGEWHLQRRDFATTLNYPGGEPQLYKALTRLKDRGFIEHDQDGILSTIRLGERAGGAPHLA